MSFVELFWIQEFSVVLQEFIALFFRQDWDVGQVSIFPVLLHLFGGQLELTPLPWVCHFPRQAAQGGVVQGQVLEVTRNS